MKTASFYALDQFRARGESLPLTPAAFDAFNRDIQAAIEAAPYAESVLLAQLKLDVNKRIYRHQRGQNS